ncbi:MAG: DNA cytosine methyltransferase [Gemmatimonadales bacterium]|nr:DNA cytosine methyltransferase [Gemmatimonadales bacterium]
MTTYGALFAGYGGLELGVQSVLGGQLAWYAEIDPAPSRVLAHHYPGVRTGRGLSRPEQLKCLGNGVVPQQAAAATAAWVADTRSERAA